MEESLENARRGITYLSIGRVWEQTVRRHTEKDPIYLTKERDEQVQVFDHIVVKCWTSNEDWEHSYARIVELQELYTYWLMLSFFKYFLKLFGVRNNFLNAGFLQMASQ